MTVRSNNARDPGIAIRRILELPTLPVVGRRLIEDLADDEADIPRIAAVIEMDPGLTARIVGLANSAYFVAPSPVYTVSDAIGRVLGLELVRGIALGVALNAPFDPRRCPGFRCDRYWFVAVATASLGRSLAPELRPPVAGAAESAFLCGLLCNIGLMVLASVHPAAMDEVFREAVESDGEPGLAVLEERVLGINHRQAAAVLARRWHLPQVLAAALEEGAEARPEAEHAALCRLVARCRSRADVLYERCAAGEEGAAHGELHLRDAFPDPLMERAESRLVDRLGDLEDLARRMASHSP
jgi:HD-like signal output (HDOD) protein